MFVAPRPHTPDSHSRPFGECAAGGSPGRFFLLVFARAGTSAEMASALGGATRAAMTSRVA
jgi:hypothetical protein